MFGIVVVVPLALALLFPNLVPQLESDSIPLFGHHAIYSTLVALLVVLPFAAAVLGLASRRTIRETEIARGIALGGGSIAVPTLGIFVLMDLYALAFGGEHARVWAARLIACLVLLVMYAVFRADRSARMAYWESGSRVLERGFICGADFVAFWRC